jgi:ABC-type transport system involved in multi-copper enzyme maturation permease subunit
VLLIARLLVPLALGEGLRLIVDIGLSAVSAFGMLVIMLVGTSLVSKEIERRTIYNLLSRPLPRPLYLIGKWAGLSAALWTVALLLGAAVVALAMLGGGAARVPAILVGVYMAGLELTVMAALATLFSALSTPVLSALYTLGFYCAGQWSYDLRVFAAKFPPALGAASEALATVLPNLPAFNVRGLAAVGQAPEPLQIGIATLYALLYVGGTLSLAAVAFEGRDFR